MIDLSLDIIYLLYLSSGCYTTSILCVLPSKSKISSENALHVAGRQFEVDLTGESLLRFIKVIAKAKKA